MSLSIGITGLPNVGKSTLFNALTLAGVPASNYPFCTIDQNVGLCTVPDTCLDKLSDILKPSETMPSVIRFVDIAGLVAGASKGEGLGNQFLAHIREVDALIHVVRIFNDENVSHVTGAPNPLHDAQIVEAELQIADIETTEKALPKIEKEAKAKEKFAAERLSVLEKIHKSLSDGVSIRDIGLSNDEKECLRGKVTFVSDKPVIYLLNISENDIGKEDPVPKDFREWCKKESILYLSAKIEAEIAELPREERPSFLEAMGLTESGLVRLIQMSFKLLGLITFYTIAHDKLRAWEIPDGTLAPAAAGKIHSDMEAGFIRAEVAGYEDLVAHPSMKELRAAGLVRAEGRDYKISDRDVVLFHFR